MPALPLTYSVATSPAHSTLSGTAPNLTYTPNSGYHGADSFTFRASNGINTSAPATVTFSIAVGNPTADAQTVTVYFNTTTAITLTGSDPDVPALPLTYSVAVVSPVLCTTSKVGLFVNRQAFLFPAAADPMPA